MTEAQFQAQVVDYLALCLPNNALFFAVPNGGWRAKKTGADLKRQGVKAGVADLVIVYWGHIYFLELKVGSAPLSKVQEAFRRDAVLAGGRFGIARTLYEVEKLLKDWQIPIRAVQI